MPALSVCFLRNSHAFSPRQLQEGTCRTLKEEMLVPYSSLSPSTLPFSFFSSLLSTEEREKKGAALTNGKGLCWRGSRSLLQASPPSQTSQLWDGMPLWDISWGICSHLHSLETSISKACGTPSKSGRRGVQKWKDCLSHACICMYLCPQYVCLSYCLPCSGSF